MNRLALAAVCFGSSLAAAAPCPLIENKPIALTAANAAIADGGGIVVATMPEREGAKSVTATPITTWRLSDGSAPALAHLAPGLDVLAATGPITLETGDHKTVIVHVEHGGAVPLLGAPGIAQVVRNSPRGARHPFTLTTAVLASPPPAGALALIVFDKAGTTARSWGALPAGEAKRILIYARGSCETLPDGTTDSGAGDRIRLAYVDASGRLSKLSDAVKVTEQDEK